MVTLAEAIKRIDRSKENDAGVYSSKLFDEVNVAEYDYIDLEEHGFSAFYLSKWYCTDTWVGVTVIFYNDEPVAVTSQTARKSSINYEWASEAAFVAVRQKLFDLSRPTNSPAIAIFNPDDELGEGYGVAYGAQLLVKENLIVKATGERVNVTSVWRDYKDIDKWSIVEVDGPNGKRPVDLDELLIPWPLIEVAA